MRHDDLTVGVVIEVPEPWGEDLTEWRIGFGDPHAEKILAHITLLAPVRMSAQQFADLPSRLNAECGRLPAFAMALGPIGTFRPVSPVVYLQAHADADALPLTQAAVWRAAGEPPQRHAFVAHCTVAMDVPDSVLDAAADALRDYTAAWQVSEVLVLTRDPDGSWQRRFSVPLLG